jgi:alpha-beta hydrolase superfamily lysophospholipase
MTMFARSPAPALPAREIVVDVDGVPISGLLAEPASPPRALVVAVHGAGVHAGYFHCTTAPGLSLLDVGSALGYTVWAPDRPGVGSSTGLPSSALTMSGQAEVLRRAVAAFAQADPVGAGIVLVGHSYGLKVALIAGARGVPHLLGIEGSGTGIELAPLGRRSRGESGPAWGPRRLYPRGTFVRANLPISAHANPSTSEAAIWPAVLAETAPCISVPLRFTFAEHERFFRTDADQRDALRALFANAPSVDVEIQADAGHNISLGWAARAYHLKALAFVEQCAVAANFVASLVDNDE